MACLSDDPLFCPMALRTISNRPPAALPGTSVWLFLSGISCLLFGCIVVPIPEEHQFAQGRRTISDRELEQLVPGVSNRESVLLTFGEPDVVSAGGDKFAYKWHMNKAFWLAILGGDYSAQIFGGDIPEKHLIILSFDEEGILQEFTADEFYIAGMDLKLREQGFTREGKLIVLRSHLPPISQRLIQEGDSLRIHLTSIADNRSGFQNSPDILENFQALGVFMSDVSVDESVEDAVRRLIENKI